MVIKFNSINDRDPMKSSRPERILAKDCCFLSSLGEDISIFIHSIHYLSQFDFACVSDASYSSSTSSMTTAMGHASQSTSAQRPSENVGNWREPFGKLILLFAFDEASLSAMPLIYKHLQLAIMGSISLCDAQVMSICQHIPVHADGGQNGLDRLGVVPIFENSGPNLRCSRSQVPSLLFLRARHFGKHRRTTHSRDVCEQILVTADITTHDRVRRGW